MKENKPLPERTCPTCRRNFTPPKISSTYCSQVCARKKVGMYEAAGDLMAAFSIGQQGTTIPCTMPKEEDPSPTPNQKTAHPFDAIATSLQYDHPVLSEKGLSLEECTRLGIGFKKANVMRGLVLIPLRDETGTVTRCLGMTPETFADTTLGKPFDLSPDTNVVSFPKKTA